ncbi:peptide deformylase [Leucobacter massiliensis]|uniref:Peptide deformylase n=1 Tax=Leucobacter massiliensis TaxID=1686285 RepID=A0A2S9QQU9_9MICO|nr:peptide deformylase [Leucobacter massiliensis]PRI11957.1 peptide deformylase [Leucobacter massiliensis]
MSVLPIVISGEPVLHRPAEPVTEFDDALRALVDDMFDTTVAAPGVGLAAPQVGVGLRVFVWIYEDQDVAPERGVAINPELWIAPPEPGLPGEDEVEGCLSFPGERFALRRSPRALLRAQDIEGKPFELEAEGWFARILQHEFDHLNGLLYVDRLVHPENRGAQKAQRKNGWGRPGLSWLPGVDDLEG